MKRTIFFYKKGEQRKLSFAVGENGNWYNYFVKLEVLVPTKAE